MTEKTISTPDLFAGFAGDSSTSSRGVSEVVGTASLIVLALGLVGGVAVRLGGVTDGINNNGLDGDFQFNQDGDELTVVVNSLSDAATDSNAFFAIQVQGQTVYDPDDPAPTSSTPNGGGATQVLSQSDGGGSDTAGELQDFNNAEESVSTGFVEATPKTGQLYTIDNSAKTAENNPSLAPPEEGTTVTITAFDGNGNSQVIGQFTYGSTN